jgi:aspartate/methionine/tyrosine aminotransferase
LVVPIEIPEVQLLDDLLEIARGYEIRFGTPPTNLSHWDPSPRYAAEVSSRIPLPDTSDLASYVYSYDLPGRDRIATRLGFPPSVGCHIAPSGTVALACIGHWLRRCKRVRRVVVLCPAYFCILHYYPTLGLEVETVPLEFSPVRYRLPQGLVEAMRPDEALLVSNPVYSTSVRLEEEDLQALRELVARGGVVVCDETLAVPGTEIGPALRSRGDVVGVYSPHKALLVNGVKFCALVHPSEASDFFDGWSDVQYGGLPYSSAVALQHYLSDGFPETLDEARKLRAQAHAAVQSIVRQVPDCHVDPLPDGVFVSCYLPAISADLGEDREFMLHLVEGCGTFIIPGIRNHFPASCGFSFRLNLLRCDDEFMGALVRLLQFLALG